MVGQLRPGFHLPLLVPLGSGVTPPEWLSGDPVSVPPDAEDVKLPAVVLVEFVVDERGKPRDLEVVKSGGKTLDQASRKAIATWRYRPATQAGVKVRVRQSYQFNFKAK